MTIDIRQVHKIERKLQKSLKKTRERPSPDHVHDLRTSIRRAEAFIRAFGSPNKGKGRNLLRDLDPIRKRAGKVRDVDVLIGDLVGLHTNGDSGCTVQLIEHLGGNRRRLSKKLSKKLTSLDRDGRLCRQVKRVFAQATKRIQENGSSGVIAPPEQGSAHALELARELAAPGALGRHNIHGYRKKLKELRDLLQNANGPSERLMKNLGTVKDAIGEWHDWDQLVRVAQEVLRSPQGRSLMAKLKSTRDQKYKQALSATARLRAEYFPPSTSRQHKKPPRPLIGAITQIAS